MKAQILKNLLLSVALFGVSILTACGDGGGGDAYGEGNPMEISSDAITVQLRNLQFQPKGIKVKTGTTVTWVNKDDVLHNVSQIEKVFLSQDEMQPGDTFTFTFETPGTYRYQCTFHHPNMNGVVIVGGE